MFDRWRYPAAFAVAVGISFPALATAAPQLTTKAEGAKRPAAKRKHRHNPLNRPIRGLHRTIDVQVTEIRKHKRHKRHKRRHRFAHLPGGVSQSTLDSIAACESGGNPHAVSAGGTYRGKYQFDYGTWASVGGHGDPAAASESEQDYRAALLYSHSGSSPWPVCG